MSTARRTLLQSEEVFEEVKLWYKNLGQPVPLEDAKWCLAEIAAEKKEAAAFQEMLKNPPPVEAPKPSYGTPEFWKQYWAKKRAAGFVSKKDARGSRGSKN
jgi:hypothetical protein